MTDPIRKLIEKWRTYDPGDSSQKNEYYTGRAHGSEAAFAQAAEELEAALAAESTAEPPELVCRSNDSTLEHIAGSLTSYTEPFRSMAAELLWWRRAWKAGWLPPAKGKTSTGRDFVVWHPSVRANGWQPFDQPHPDAYLPHAIERCELVELAGGAAVLIAPAESTPEPPAYPNDPELSITFEAIREFEMKTADVELSARVSEWGDALERVLKRAESTPEQDARRRLGEWLAANPSRSWHWHGDDGQTQYTVVLYQYECSWAGSGNSLAEAIARALDRAKVVSRFTRNSENTGLCR